MATQRQLPSHLVFRMALFDVQWHGMCFLSNFPKFDRRTQQRRLLLASRCRGFLQPPRRIHGSVLILSPDVMSC